MFERIEMCFVYQLFRTATFIADYEGVDCLEKRVDKLVLLSYTTAHLRDLEMLKMKF